MWNSDRQRGVPSAAVVNFRKKSCADKYCRIDCQSLHSVCSSRSPGRADPCDRGRLLYGAAFRDQHRHQHADFPESGLAPARPAIRPGVRPRQHDPGRGGSADAGTHEFRGRGARAEAQGRQQELPVHAAARFRRILRQERAVVPFGGRGRQDHVPVRICSPPDRDHGRRSLHPRTDRRARDWTCRRQARAGQARQYRAPVQPDFANGRGCPEQGRRHLLLAPARQRHAADRFRPPRLHRVQAGARLQRAGARQGRHRCDPQGRRRSRLSGQVPGPRQADRAGSDRQRGIRHRPERRRGQRHRHRDRGADHPVAGAAFGQDHLRRVRQSVYRSVDHHRAGADDGGLAEPALDRVRSSVRRPRRRFRHPVQRPLPLRAFQERQSAGGAGGSGAAGGGTAFAGRDGHLGRIPLFPADRLQGHLRTRGDCRRRHDRRVHLQHHGAAGAVEAAQPARREGTCRLRVPRAGRPLPRKAPHRHHRRHARGRDRRPAAVVLHEVRLQPDESAQQECRVHRHFPRSEERPQHRRQRHRRHDQFRRRRQEDRSKTREIAGSAARDVARQFRAARSGAEAEADRAGRQGAQSRAQSGPDRRAAERPGERRFAEGIRR